MECLRSCDNRRCGINPAVRLAERGDLGAEINAGTKQHYPARQDRLASVVTQRKVRRGSRTFVGE